MGNRQSQSGVQDDEIDSGKTDQYSEDDDYFYTDDSSDGSANSMDEMTLSLPPPYAREMRYDVQEPGPSGLQQNIPISKQYRHQSNDDSSNSPDMSPFHSDSEPDNIRSVDILLPRLLSDTKAKLNGNSVQSQADTASLFELYFKQLKDTSIRVTIIKDIQLEEDELSGNRSSPYCDNCLERDLSARIMYTKSISKSVCFDCNQYLCAYCQPDHSGHLFSKMSDQFNNNTCIELMLDQLLKEKDTDQLEELYSERFSVCDNVALDHPEDGSDMNLAGTICFLKHKRKSVVSDVRNPCIKVMDMSNNQIVRYIKFSSMPIGVTEILDDISPFTTFGSANTETGQKQHLVAMWFLVKSFISILDINSSPATIVKYIPLQGECHGVFYSKKKLIVHCSRYEEDKKTIDVMTIDGQTINVIDLSQPEINLYGMTPIEVAVHAESKTIYVCINTERKIYSLDIEGVIQNTHTFKRFSPLLICVDEDQHVYVCTEEKPYQIYKMSSDFRRCNLFIHDILRNMATEQIKALSCCTGKFYVGYKLDSGQTLVTTIRPE